MVQLVLVVMVVMVLQHQLLVHLLLMAAAAALDPRPSRAYGEPHPELGQQVVLAVHGEGSLADAEALRAELQRRLPKHHAPRRVEFRHLDQTPSGKWKRPHAPSSSSPPTTPTK